jgi:hydrogenase maturation protease
MTASRLQSILSRRWATLAKVLIAGMGNILRRDDGFGVEVAKRLAAENTLPTSARVIEVGIGGIHLVQELMAGYDMLVVIDALERGSAPGTVHVLAAEVPDLADWPEIQRQDFLADMHYTTPSKALILAKALGVLPSKAFIVGCQPVNVDDLGIGLSASAEGAMTETIQQIERLVRQFLGVG